MKKLLGILVIVAAAISISAFRLNSAPPAVIDESLWLAAEFGTIKETISASATLQPSGVVAVGADMPGRITRTFVELHQIVKVNEPLAQLDDRMNQLRLQQAKVSVELAQADVQRAEAARDTALLALNRAREPQSNSMQPRDVPLSELQYRGAEAGLRAAQLKVREAHSVQLIAEQATEMSIIRAPIAGIVIEKRVTAGQQIAPPISLHLFSIAPNLERMQAIAHVSESDIGRLKVGQSASFTVNSFLDHAFQGKITRIASVPVAQQSAVHYPVTIDVANAISPGSREWRLKPGMPAAVDVVVRQREGVWKLPAAAAGVQIADSKLSDDARKKITRWKNRGDAADWQRVWTIKSERQWWPIYARVGGHTSTGETGIQDGQWLEVIAWDPEEPEPTIQAPLRVLIAAPADAKPEKPGLKLF